MRCTEARRRLRDWRSKSQERKALDLQGSQPESTGSDLGSAGSEFAIDKELAEHLRLCPACARVAEAMQVMRRDFATAAADDLTDTIPFAALKTRVETQASLKHRSRHTENTIMAEIANQFRRRPRLSFGVVVMALIVAGSVLIPIRYNKTIGYEVAVAGVDKDLALDQQRVRVFLEQLGVSDPQIDVSDCDSTCVLTIRDLKSAVEAQIVVEAFGEVPNVQIKKGVTEICGSEKGNLIEFTADRIVMSKVKLRPIGEIKQMVFERLGEDPVIVLCNDSASSTDGVWSVNCDSGLVMYNFQMMCDSANPQVALYSAEGTRVIGLAKDGSLEGYTIVTKDGKVDTLAWIVEDSADLQDDEEDSEPADKAAAVELPEGYELGQNYPNPFNPTTKIDYSVPTAQWVKIDVVNINGQVVRTLVNEVVSAGTHTVEWDAKTDDGKQVATGVYIYRLMAGDVTQTRKMTYVK